MKQRLEEYTVRSPDDSYNMAMHIEKMNSRGWFIISHAMYCYGGYQKYSMVYQRKDDE